MSNNPKITCNQWEILQCPCPAKGCGDTEVGGWIHKNCTAALYINSDAYLWCKQDNAKFRIIDTEWSCGRHEGEYREADMDDLVTCLTMAAGQSALTEKKAWARKLIQSIVLMR